ncbi:MAG TPA: glycoside hydrolase family 66 protein [Anaerolineales bacterium]|nr:glycoside hydrolase family 66 protein [Anaerolineales bacterium]
MPFFDLFPAQGSFRPGEPVYLWAELREAAPPGGEFYLTITHLANEIQQILVEISSKQGRQRQILAWEPPTESPRGYGARLDFRDSFGNTLASASTAFDVLPDWTANPRYGFLTDFAPGRNDVESTLDALLPFHVNGLQFYDWQYRHNHLLPPTPEFTDPLGRRLSLPTIAAFIEAARPRGMATMPYLVIYAASLEFWENHPTWALYGENGQPLTFFDFLGLMDPTPGSPWAAHLQAECARVLAQLPFDGLHVDQYGEPKTGTNASGQPVDLPAAFGAFISALKKDQPAKSVVFNAVGNWPIETLAASLQDFEYIEVWPPDTAYCDFARIVQGARRLSRERPVVVAVYIPAARETNHLLANAIITACGGSRILIGEGARLLTNPYFPKHEALTPQLQAALRKQLDFAVHYQALAGPSAEDWTDYDLQVMGGIWTVGRRAPGWRALHFVNFLGVEAPHWDKPHASPTSQRNFRIRTRLQQRVRQVWWASADQASTGMSRINWGKRGEWIEAEIPSLDIWGMLAFEIDGEE